MTLDVAVFFVGPNYDKAPVPAVGITVIVFPNITPLPPAMTQRTDSTGMAHLTVDDGVYIVEAQYQGSNTGGPLIPVSSGNGNAYLYLPYDPPSNNTLLYVGIGVVALIGIMLVVKS